jgi:hypothetical protein
MDEFGRTSLLMLAASIGAADDWVMSASSGAVTLTPLRMMSDEERRSTIDRSALLRLTDLGHLNGAEVDGAALTTSPLSTSVVVLLLSWSLQATVARLDAMARTSTAMIPPCYAHEDWLEVSHHFVDDGVWQRGLPSDALAKRANVLPGLPPGGRRHFIFGSPAAETETETETEEVKVPASQGARHGHFMQARAHGTQELDPLAYTNPGSVPEGLSPLFARNQRPGS